MKKVIGLAVAILGLALPVSAQTPKTDGQVKQARADLTKFDLPLSWLQEAKRNYAAIKDYSCTLASEERVRGKMLDQNIIQMKVKTEPFSVYMRWLAPKSQQNQEVAFVLGKNGNMMRVKSNVLGNRILGFMSIAPNDSRVMDHSRHTILEAGIGNLIEQTLRNWEKERQLGKSEVRISEAVYNDRKCYRIETINTERRPELYCYRGIIYLEQTAKLPIFVENYDWPRSGGPAGGDLMERFRYVNIQFNTGLTDRDFDK